MSFWASVGQGAMDLLGNRMGQRESYKDRKFQQEEAQKYRDFTSGEATRAMDFSSAEAIANRTWQAEQAQKSMSFSDRQAQRQMDYQERMSSTQHQRAAADLAKAGLNRILALGQPAAMASGAAASGAMGGGAQGQSSMGSGAAGSGSRSTPNRLMAGIETASAMAHVQNLKEQNKYLHHQARREKALADKEEITKLPYDWLVKHVGPDASGADAISRVKNWLSERQNKEPITIDLGISKWLQRQKEKASAHDLKKYESNWLRR